MSFRDLVIKYCFSIGLGIAFIVLGIYFSPRQASGQFLYNLGFVGLWAAWNVLPLFLLESFSSPAWARWIYKGVAGVGFVWQAMMLYGVYFQDSGGDASLGFIFAPIYIGGVAITTFILLNMLKSTSKQAGSKLG